MIDIVSKGITVTKKGDKITRNMKLMHFMMSILQLETRSMMLLKCQVTDII